MSCTKYGTLLMFSVPPATAMLTSPAWMPRRAMVMAAMDEQQARSTLLALAVSGMPALSMDCLAIERSLPGRLMPMSTSSTSSGSTAARRTASAITTAPSSGSQKSLSVPPKAPNGVRTPEATITSRIAKSPQPAAARRFDRGCNPASSAPIRVLAQLRRGTHRRDGARQARNGSGHAVAADDGILDLRQHLAGEQMRVSEQLRGVLHWADRQPLRQQRLRRLGLGAPAEPRLGQGLPAVAVLTAPRPRLNIGIVQQLLVADGLAELLPVRLDGADQGHVAVAAAKRTPGGDEALH